MRESTLLALSGAMSRLMDELPVVILGAIALGLIAAAKNHDLAGLVHDGVLGIITGFFGYMRGRSVGRSAHPGPESPPSARRPAPAAPPVFAPDPAPDPAAPGAEQ